MKSKYAITGLTMGSEAHKWLEYSTLDIVPISDPDHYHLYDSGVVTIKKFSESSFEGIDIYTQAEFEEMLKAKEKDFLIIKDGKARVPKEINDRIKMDFKSIPMNFDFSNSEKSYPVHPDDAFNPSAKLESYDKEYELLKDYEDPNGRVAKGVVKKEYQWMSRFALLNPGDCGIKTDWFKEVKIIENGKLVHPNDAFKSKEETAKEISESERKAYDILKKGVEDGAIFNPAGRSTEDTTAKEDLRAIPYQRCPICDGHGRVTSNGATSSVFDTCSVCNGAKIIPMCIMGREVDVQEQLTGNTTNIADLIFEVMKFADKKFTIDNEQDFINMLSKKYNVTRK